MIKTVFGLTIKTYLVFQIITRILLSVYAIWNQQVSIIDLPAVFLIGTVNDLVSVIYIVPAILTFNLLGFLLLARCKFTGLGLRYVGYCIFTTCLTFISSSEIIFWDEFGTRFNFIAVDYLIYTHEIIGTVKESLPYIEMLSIVVLLAVGVTYLMRTTLRRVQINITHHLICISISLVLNFLAFKFYDPERITFLSNKYSVELSKNGPYEFCSAFMNNSLDYNAFYPTIDRDHALQIVRAALKQNDQEFLTTDSIERFVHNSSHKSHKYNVVYIAVESLSSHFLGSFGDKHNITPNLDKIAQSSIFFTQLYATGTRTVRGLEAITLSAPPIPGSAIIRRPENYNLFNLGTIFREQGYKINFVFGGYSYFDNLQNYFHGNGYHIIDRGDLRADEISFANIWGVADEDILTKSLELADQDFRAGRPFFSLIMTTSNHRPYTFPDDRIDLPSGSGRFAAVKYTDYAIGKFLAEARSKQWFNNTIFIISADHCAASAGKTDLPVEKYHIPLMIYAPKILAPRVVKNLASQIDIAPTIVGLLGFQYKSKFWGQDTLKTPANRAFISTYQLLGFMKNDHLVILSPKSLPKTYKLIGDEKQLIPNLPDLTEEAISFYQTAYDLYVSGKMRE